MLNLSKKFLIENEFISEQNWNGNGSNLVRWTEKHYFPIPRISKTKIRDFNIGLSIVTVDARITSTA